MNYSLIVWEDVTNIPFPEEVKNIIADIKWAEYPWQVIGLPVPYAKYTIANGKTLYLEELPGGRVDLQKQELTGEYPVINYFVDKDPEGTNYYLELKVTFIKGEVTGVEIVQCVPQKNAVYQEQINSMQAAITNTLKLNKSFCYRFLYKPFFYGIRIPSYILIMTLTFLRWSVLMVTKVLTPH